MLHRRHFLVGAGLLATGIPAPRASASAAVEETIPLWPGPPPGGGGPAGPQRETARGAVTNVVVPGLTVVRPANPNGVAVLVAGGGGYKRIEMGSEARPAAAWLTVRGITAYVLAYRLPGEGWPQGPLAPLQDAQRALRLIRARAGADRLDPNRVGVLGFSAGGHLMGLAATRSDFMSYPPQDEVDRHSARPDGAALIYPVVTLMPPYDHTETRRILVGREPSPDDSAAWSVQTHVARGCPPVFLVAAEDDPIANPANTREMAAACVRAGVPAEVHLLSSGGHGFGMGRPGSPTASWPGLYAAWFERQAMGGGRHP